jgi:hypothetical protein
MKDLVLLAASFYLLKQDVLRISGLQRNARDGGRLAPAAAEPS